MHHTISDSSIQPTHRTSKSATKVLPENHDENVCQPLCIGVMAWLIRDDRLLISIRNSFFSGSPFGQNSKVKRAQLGVVSGWVTDQEVAPGCT